MAGVDGFGTQLRRGNGASPTEVFTAIANATNITGPGLTRATIDTTTHQSPNQWMEKIGGLKDGGEVSITINYDPDVHDVLVADLDDAAPRNYQLAWPTTPETVWGFAAVMTGFEPEGPHDDKLTATLTFAVTGQPVLT
jgi:predicted secreted protein